MKMLLFFMKRSFLRFVAVFALGSLPQPPPYMRAVVTILKMANVMRLENREAVSERPDQVG